ncbi:esterase, PHB depolymerase family [Hoeflea sp. IMCC20628]|uniref:extracellular catalytic domain type 1 short-chain-length polyhydroxyalkanoate depolymerase n=1 Tax=Hoeflea sp. IMCC20628 TaxID=1620421 RepID=UPI00063AE010|nr:PHB depolymerase family esterase [Hoeflea sp. IMCC20628]AKI01411.1 esterase, PHB depolymerase family [Hoeflea sp. IMCC20628]
MTFFNADALRQAMASARRGRFDPDRLVQETLSRHGLSWDGPEGVANTAADAGPGSAWGRLPGFTSPTAHAGQAFVKPETRVRPDTPASAGFTQHRFDHAAGSREFRVYRPASASKGPTGLIVMLHGCTQTPEDFAAGTAMNEQAEKHGFVVAYPAQSRGANAQTCWNWFSRGDQNRDRGEPAIIAGLTRQVCESHDIPLDRVFVAGLSAGGAMAVIMGETYPELYSGVAVHSGLPFGAARDVASAFAAMGGKPMEGKARSTMTPRTIVFHGTSDAVVHPVNGDLIARDAMSNGTDTQYQTTERGTFGSRQFEKHTTFGSHGQSSIEHWVIDGMGHAWSGGRAAGSYTDPDGPDASAEIVRFFLNPQEGNR